MTLEYFYEKVKEVISGSEFPEYKEEYIWELCEQFEYEKRGAENED